MSHRAGWQLLNAHELWRYRELALCLTWRDIMVRYKQTLLGASWAVLQPAMMMVVFTVFLGRLATVDSAGLPYPVFVYAGLSLWIFFSTAITNAGNSVIASPQMISKVYFPRLLIPLASVGAAVVDFLVSLSLLALLMLWYGIRPGPAVFLLPLLLVLATLAAVGVGSLLAALNVAYRDFKHTIPFLVQIWMFATPTIYMNVEATADSKASASSVATTTADSVAEKSLVESNRHGGLPPTIKAFLKLNPMIGLIAFFRAATLGGPLPWSQLGYSSVAIGLLLGAGLAYFRHVESSFADII